MSDDLTRWNRAGLSRFRYIDGNAPVWLEMLRQSLAEKFPDSDWQTVLNGGGSDVESMEAQYQQERSDMLWETTRAFARASHILAEYVDQYANEGYIGTATQWDNLRRLVATIDYHPAPPASASTPLVLMIKEDKSGTVMEGFQVKYSPEDGGNSVLYETLEDIDVNVTLNELRLADWDAGAGSLGDALSGGASLWIVDEDAEGLLQGQVVVVEGESGASPAAIADSIHSFDEDSGEVVLTGSSWSAYEIADAYLHLKPKSIHKPLLNGAKVVEFDVDHSLVAGNVVRWKPVTEWIYAVVQAVDGRRVSLDSETLPNGNDVYRVYEIPKSSEEGDFLVAKTDSEMVYFNGTTHAFEKVDSSDYVEFEIDVSSEDEVEEAGTAYTSAFLKIIDSNISIIYWSPDNMLPIGSAAPPDANELVFQGGYGDLSGGDWVIVEDAGDTRTALKIATIAEAENSFTVEFETAFVFPDVGIARMYGPFKYQIQAQGADNNQTALTSAQAETLPLAINSVPEELGVGRKLVIEQESGDSYDNAVAATVTDVDQSLNTITISPALDTSGGFTLGNTVIRANVVTAGHGERQPERVLGSGDVTRSNQEFLFKNAEVSFITDSAMSSGVKADIDITVDKQTWEQVSTLNDSGPTDIHYSVKMTEEGYLNICFGDGEHGRRLPTGSNNVRIAWRKGTGLSGNLDPDSLIKPVKPHYLIDEVRQPLDASGGGDMESVESLRETAPASVLTLKRAVSASDYKNLVSAHSSVWQANAFLVSDRYVRGEKIEVVVVPAGGVTLSTGLKTTLEDYLETYSVPGVQVDVTEFLSIVITLDITVRVKSEEYDVEAVKADVKAALLNRFKLEQRALGEDLYRAELYEVVEAIEGVENSKCEIKTYTGTPSRVVTGSEDVIRVIGVTERQVIYVADYGLGITVQDQEYSL